MGKVLIIKEANFQASAVEQITLGDILIEVSTSGVVSMTSVSGIIYYTTDGSEPTTNSTQYVSPFSVPFGTTVKAITELSQGKLSKVYSKLCTLIIPKEDCTLLHSAFNNDGQYLKISKAYCYEYSLPISITNIKLVNGSAVVATKSQLPSPTVSLVDIKSYLYDGSMDGSSLGSWNSDRELNELTVDSSVTYLYLYAGSNDKYPQVEVW